MSTIPYETFRSDGVEIAFARFAPEGEAAAGAPPVLLIHGFASNIAANWVDPGWVKTLTRAGRTVIALDNRGHGRSEKLYDEAAYTVEHMAADARRLLDHLGIGEADVMGYSMGTRITAKLTIDHPERVRRAVFGGLGNNLVRGLAGAKPIAAALLAPSIDEVTNATARTFRAFAESTRSDLKALAACILASRGSITPERLGTIRRPVLVAVGSDDVIGGSAEELAALIPGAQALVIAGRDHQKSVGDRNFKERVLAFLA
jgi:pimeloyl-ACP methyl ester carboxylesterase